VIPLTLEEIAQMLLDQFDTADANNSGWISIEEAQAACAHLDPDTVFHAGY
jgi:hypothetical protein